MSTWETFDRATIYVAFNPDLRAGRRKSTGKSAALHPVGKIIVFRAVVPGMYICLTRRANEHRRGKISQTPSSSSSRTRMRRGEVRRQWRATHACRQADTRGCERKGVVDDEGEERGERLAWRLVPLSMHADGLALYWNASLSFFFPWDDGTEGRKKRWVA